MTGVIDLLKRDFDAARELYAGTWLGFSQSELLVHLETAGFTDIDLAVVDRETDPPHFQIVMPLVEKPV